MKSDLSEMFEEGIGEPQKLDRLDKFLIALLVVGFIGGIIISGNIWGFPVQL